MSNYINLEQLAQESRFEHHPSLFPPSKDLEPFLTFSSHEEYREWVQEWKEHYRELSEHIRKLKRELRKPHELPRTPRLQGRKLKASALARALLALRKEGKVVSQQMGREQE